MYDTSDIKKGLKVVFDGAPYTVVEFQFVKPGKGQAFTRTKFKNLVTGSTLERTFKSGEKLAPADTEERDMQFLYREGDQWVFMDVSTYDQVLVQDEQMDDTRGYLVDGTQVTVLFYLQRPIQITPPTFVELAVTHTEPGFKGDTSSSITKPATMETGLEVGVPPFINIGEVLKIDTRTGEYVERVKK